MELHNETALCLMISHIAASFSALRSTFIVNKEKQKQRNWPRRDSISNERFHQGEGKVSSVQTFSVNGH